MNNEEFVQKWTMYYRGTLLNPKDHRDMPTKLRHFIDSGKWMISRPMTKEEFDSDKYA